MSPADKIRSRLIDKIMAIKNEDFLIALDRLIVSSNQSESVSLTSEQIEMLRMSEEDIKAGRTISNEEVDKSDLEWLNSQ